MSKLELVSSISLYESRLARTPLRYCRDLITLTCLCSRKLQTLHGPLSCNCGRRWTPVDAHPFFRNR